MHNTRDYKYLNNRKIFSNIKNQLKTLEKNGIIFTIDGQETTIYFSLLGIIGDNLGLHEILGFTMNFKDAKARNCLSNKGIRVKQCKENIKSIRTKATYNKHSKLQSNGIKETCIFNDLLSYHAIDNMTVDIMHDFYEGICRYVMGKVLKNLIKNKYFTLKNLNWKIKFFYYGSSHGINIPPPIKMTALNKGMLIMSASEMKTLIKYLGFYVGNSISEQNKEWKLFTYLREMIYILNSSIYTNEKIEKFKKLVSLHHALYIKIFDLPLTFKFHNIVHYHRLMKSLGPLNNFSCMRPEGLHSLLKTIAQSIKSRVNPAHSLAIKYQQHLSLRFFDNNSLSPNISWKLSEPKNLAEIKEINAFNNLIPVSLSQGIVASLLEIYGSRYEINQCLIIDNDDDENLQFGRIRYITFIDDKSTDRVAFLFTKMKTVSFSYRFQGFNVLDTEDWGIIFHKDLFDFEPLNTHTLSDDLHYITVL